MKKIISCFLCMSAFICIFASHSRAATHVAMMDEQYLEEQMQKYREKVEKEEAEKKAKEEAYSTNIVQGFSVTDIELLCKICHAESRGEGERGQMAVANVILNRVKSSRFPNTIEGVIFQKGQFTPAARKSFHSIVPSDEVRQSVQKVLAGERVLSDDVLYFKSVSSKASWSNYTFKTQIGRHLFYAA